MKQKYLLFIIIVLIFFNSCESILDYHENPPLPKEIAFIDSLNNLYKGRYKFYHNFNKSGLIHVVALNDKFDYEEIKKIMTNILLDSNKFYLLAVLENQWLVEKLFFIEEIRGKGFKTDTIKCYLNWDWRGGL